MRYLTPLLILLALLTLGGCSTQGRVATLRLQPQRDAEAFVQRFANAYAVTRDDGQTDVVLTDTTSNDLTLYMHLRLLWRPMSGTKTDQPSTTNAVIDWYVFSQDEPRKMLRYTGAGLVTANPSAGDKTYVSIRNASLRLAARRGDLVDPVGPSTLTGSFHAQVDSGQVERALADLESNTRAAGITRPQDAAR